MDRFRRSRRLAGIAVTLGVMVAGLAGTPAMAQANRSRPYVYVGVSWGSNLNGQLGDGNGYSSSTYVGVSGLQNVAQLATGHAHSLAVTTAGSVYAWGYNGSGQLGTGDKNNYPSPQLVAGLSGITQVAAGWDHSLALGSDGTVWAWGNNQFGQLGDGTDTQRLTPVQVAGLTGVTQIAAGNGWSLALRSDGTVWAWGNNAADQLGYANPFGTVNPSSATPVQVAGLSRVTSIAAGALFGMAVETRGNLTVLNSVMTWGEDSDGTIGNGSACYPPPCGVAVPQVVNGLNVPDVEGIAAGNEFALVLGTDGSVWGWGDGAYGDLGNGGDNFQGRPTLSIGPGSGITQLVAGALHAVALLSNGTVEAWGYNEEGQLGDGTTSVDSLTPVPVTGLTGVQQVSAGGNTSGGVQAVVRIPF
jgi:alpha-tubulin suppressor-like RCC1 family protein